MGFTALNISNKMHEARPPTPGASHSTDGNHHHIDEYLVYPRRWRRTKNRKVRDHTQSKEKESPLILETGRRPASRSREFAITSGATNWTMSRTGEHGLCWIEA